MYLVTDETATARRNSRGGQGAVGALTGFMERFLGAVWAKSRGPARKRMRVIETMALGAKKQLLLVSCDGERFLVGTGADQVQTIVRLGSELEANEEVLSTVAGECV